jgi:hypothetical protein
MTEEPRQPTEEELRAAFEEEMKKIRVEDVLVQTAVTLVNLAGRKLSEEERDLDQAKLGIEGARALVPLMPDEPAAAVRDALAQLQMMFARAAKPAAGEPPKPGEPAKTPEDEEREKARSKIWTPPGT